MALLPKVPWVDMDDARVATDAPVSTDLMTDISVNENYLKAVLTDGAASPQAISSSNITANGDLTATNDLQVDNDGTVDGDFHIGGTLTGGGVGLDDTYALAALNLVSNHL